jgi:hypothetical protein
MSEPASEAFLNGEGIPVALHQIEQALEDLWGPAADREGGPEHQNPTVTRLILSNLVVADLTNQPARLDPLLESLSRRYPSRIILLRTAPGVSRTLAADVAALCHLPTAGRPQVCSERIVLKAPSAAYDLLPGAIRPLLITDLPMILWWCGDTRPASDLFRDLADESSRLILDLPDPDADPLAVQEALNLELNLFDRDLAWFGITPWRELVAQFFDPPGSEAALADLREIHLVAHTPRLAATRPPRVALWLAAWLAGQLGWQARSCRCDSPGHFTAVFQRPQGPVTFTIESIDQPGLAQPQLEYLNLQTATVGCFRLRRQSGSPEVIATTDSPRHDALPRLVRAPDWDDEHRLAAALESDRDDPPYRNALPHLLWMLSATEEA